MGHQKMRWDQLLCEERQGHEQHPDETRQERSQFERDFDRIIFSESLRRLKDKTQVFPVTDNDHVQGASQFCKKTRERELYSRVIIANKVGIMWML